MNLVWIRNDLRLDDHPALYHACQQGGPVRVLYCITPKQWQEHQESAAKLAFRQDALNHLGERLAERGIALDSLEADRFDALPHRIADYCQAQGVTALWFNGEVPVDERLRDQQVTAALRALGIACHEQPADLILPKPVLNQQGNFFKVFTPWYRTWLRGVETLGQCTLPEPPPVAPPLPVPSPLRLPGTGPYRSDLWPASETQALAELHHFLQDRRGRYGEMRDIPSVNGTSRLSPYLASGLLSPRRCLQLIQQHSAVDGGEWREDPWLRELAWREFYRYLMIGFPRLSRNQPFLLATGKLQWEEDETGVLAWQQGQTGFPLVDAGMRQLKQTGWMHNRLRMLTASFLCKLLLVDWRVGERFFMEQLLDGDFPSNNGGWQWSASTGCDASPWFRIFNPTRQSERFDPEGHFIRKLVPELASLDGRQIHNPPAPVRQQLGYPAPIIDYRQSRERALERFRSATRQD
ncbi:cryptochrome/photolyase family protein [Aestuariirhabdus litorea]|uniref:Deoxyribodipyrimidine photo-lyase n=1 Tax=Aestuariirhabdus litorea TaxID=2528527 RepID=A0A3P3VJ48_9GAMM|nr:FAD-binding domain-containing protein [Aestuariirhabdus litorea]RRJ82745.1 deoxyribodipyrimidine photo-lyase [Aestuariirhabdus litorea]RWW92906.1 deoxyribodipyrimidine photo-lyase [Endozoicomonadaceae bacterium GTF-13]